ncbi:16902_t:CDS:1, partial [Gigaspora rosea]
ANFSIDREGEHQMDCYTIFGLPSRSSQESVLYAPKLISTWLANGGSIDKAIKDIS